MDITGFITGLVTQIVEEFSLFGLIEKLVVFFETNSIITFIIFCVSLFFLYKLVRLAFRIFLVVIAGLIFPFAMNFLFGWEVPITTGVLIFYATFAVVMFLLAIFAAGVLKFLKTLSSPIRKSAERKKIEKEIEEDLKKKDS